MPGGSFGKEICHLASFDAFIFRFTEILLIMETEYEL